MPEHHTKQEAEAILRELPSVLGAFVREDINGNPREVHLLVRPGPAPRDLAKDVRELLEERLQVPVDQRVISIAQLADPDAPRPKPQEHPARRDDEERLEYVRLESEIGGGRVGIRVVLHRADHDVVGEAREVESAMAAPRAAARATAAAISAACGASLRLDVDHVSVIEAFGRDHVIVAALVTSPLVGRKPRALVGAHGVTDDVREAAVLATLKSCNRLVELALRANDERGQAPESSSSSDARETYSPVRES